MRVVMFYHSLVSDWNHGNAHFLRGVALEMLARGIDVQISEPQDAWSRQNLVRDHGQWAVERFHLAYRNFRALSTIRRVLIGTPFSKVAILCLSTSGMTTNLFDE